MPDLSQIQAQVLNLEKNRIHVLSSEFMPPTLKFLEASTNRIHSDGLPDQWPQGLEEIILEQNYLYDTDGIQWPANLKSLLLSQNPLHQWPAGLPESLERLEVNRTELAIIDPLPSLLRVFSANLSRIKSLPPCLPEGLRELYLNGNSIRLRSLPQHWGSSLQILDLDDNLLTKIPEGLPDSLTVLRLRKNMIAEIPSQLPPNLIILNVSQNRVRKIHIDTRRKPISHVFLVDNELTVSVSDYQIKNNLHWAKTIDEEGNWTHSYHKSATNTIRKAWRRYRLQKRLRTFRKTMIMKEELQQVSMHPCRAGRFEDISTGWGCGC